jgi:cytochrome c oxidase assembly protein subunit 15
MSAHRFYQFAAATALLAWIVIMLGAYVRLSDAGLGCPDWPGCYGQIAVPSSEHAVRHANQTFPQRPVETAKAWKEMIHRYLAGTLGLCIFALALSAWRRKSAQPLPVILPSVLLALVIFQALLGMWTVTLLVNPSIVTAHLLGGLATLGLLAWLTLRGLSAPAPISPATRRRLRPWAWGAVLLVIGQITLGGWTSTHYAALACTEFPRCYGGQWFPPADFTAGFTLWRPLGIDYEFGVLDSAARTAIHLSHRIGALLVLLYLGALALLLILRGALAPLRRTGLLILAVLLTQVGLGIANILGQLPLGVAVAHNGGAALLLISAINLLHHTQPMSTAAGDKRHGTTT